MSGRRVIAILVSSLLLVSAMTQQAGASSSRIVTRYPSECAVVSVRTDARGFEHTFASCTRNSTSLSYLDTVSGHVRKISTPYAGTVLALAQEHTGTYVLIADAQSVLFIAKRETKGAFLPPRRLGPTTGSAALVAADGQWWAVWATNTGYLQARTFAGRTGVPELGPPVPQGSQGLTLVRDPADQGVAAAWTGNGTTVVGRARSVDGRWKTVIAGKSDNFGQPRIAVDGRAIYVGYVLQQMTVLYSNGGSGSAFRSVPLPKNTQTRDDPMVVAGNGHIWIAWDQQGLGYCMGPPPECHGTNDYFTRLYSVDFHKTWDMTKNVGEGQGTSAIVALNLHGGRARVSYYGCDSGSLCSSDVG